MSVQRLDGPANRLSLAVGGVLAGRYVLERTLGHGASATVWLADDRKHGRKVAVKLLAPEVSRSLGAERFLREIGIVARLVHPNVLPLIDSGEVDGVLYHVAPYIAGGSLADRLRETPRLALDEALAIAADLGAALDYAHRSGVVHRDVKPANVLLADGRAVLADFGIARLHAPDPRESITSPGLVVGTPEYMSPEQASGEPVLDGASDSYSLACVVYEMLCGEPPLRGASVRETIARQVTVAPQPARVRRPDLPPAVDAALVRGLAKDPAARYRDVAAFVRALCGTDAPPAVAAEAARSVAVLPFVNASPDPENEYLSDGITDELIDALARVPGFRVAPRSSVFSLKGRPQDVRAIGALLGVSMVLEGTVRRAGDRLRITAQLSSTGDGRLLWSQRYDDAFTDMLTVQDDIARVIVDAVRAMSFAEAAPRPRLTTASPHAYALYLKGRHAWNRRTREGIAEAVRCFEQAIAVDPEYAAAHAGLADAIAMHADYRSIPVQEGFERAKAYARRALELDASLAEAHASLGWAQFIHDWDWAASEESFRRAIALDPRYASAHQWYAFLLVVRGRTADALIEAHVAQESDPTSVSIRRSLGSTYYYARRFDEAAYHLLRSIEMAPRQEDSFRMLGFARAGQGAWDDAERTLREAVQFDGGTLARAALGWLLGRTGRAAEAEAIRRALAAEAEASYVSPVCFGLLALGAGDVEGALDWIERARAQRRGWVAYLRANPVFDPLRGHARFEALAGTLELPPLPEAEQGRERTMPGLGG